MGSGIDSQSGLESTSSLELALDQAIARRFLGVQDRAAKRRRNTPPQNFAVVVASKPEQEHTPTENLRGRPTTALAVTSSESSLMRPPARLCWRGIEVSDEFQEYAARVERGEKLAPYRGPVLSRPSAEFPWSAAPRQLQMLPPGRPSLPPERNALFAQRSSLAPMAVPMIDRPSSERSVYPERGRTLRTALWLAGAVTSIVAALGVGAGTTNTAGNEFDERVYDATPLAPTPAAAPAREAQLSPLFDDHAALARSIGERQLDSLGAANAEANPNVDSKPGTFTPARSLAPTPIARRASPPASGAAIGAASTLGVSARSAESRASGPSRLTAAAPGLLPAAGGLASGAAPPSPEGALFSERPSF